MLAIGNEELEGAETLHAGDVIACDICGGGHTLQACTDSEGRPSEMLLYYKCGEDLYLAAVDNKSIMDRFRQARRGETDHA